MYTLVRDWRHCLSRIFLAIPCAFHTLNVSGGQVTASRGLIEFVKANGIEHAVLDTAAFSLTKNRSIQIMIKLRIFLIILYYSAFGRFNSALFFKSTNLGLLDRFFPALLFRLRGKRVGIFFRNSDIFLIKSESCYARFIRLLLKPYSVYFVQGNEWKKRLIELGFDTERVVVIPNWLPYGFDIATESKQLTTT